MSRPNIPLRVQKYLLSLDPNVSASTCYASAYLEVKIKNTQHNRRLSEIVSRSNQLITSNVQKLRRGHYDKDSLPFTLDLCYPLRLELPYELLTNINLNTASREEDITGILYNEYFKGRPISPVNLDCQGWWPNNFKFIGSKIRSSDFHVSLLPLIRFESDSQLGQFRDRFEQILQEINPSNVDIPVNFASINETPALEVLPKYDYNKFFLGIRINRTENPNFLLNELQLALSRDLRQMSGCRGHVVGELEPNSIVDWAESLMHMSIGVCNRGEGCTGFGQNELFYLNKRLLLDADTDNLQGLGKEGEGEELLEARGRVVLMLSGGKLVY